MLLIWDRQVCQYDEDENEQWRTVQQGVVVPDCCETVQKFMTVLLRYNWEDMTDAQAFEAGEVRSEGMDWKTKLYAMVQNARNPIEGRTRFEVARPRWSIQNHFETLQEANPGRWHEEKVPSPKYCPHCGTKLPDVERRPEPPGPVHVPVSDGDYCGTCDQRSQCCTCFYPEVAWRPVTET